MTKPGSNIWFKPGFNVLICLNGRGDKIRTCDLLVPNQTRYQLRYAPISEEKQNLLVTSLFGTLSRA